MHLVKDDLVDYITDKHGTYFARSLLALLAGTLSPDKPSTDRGGTGGASAPPHGLQEKIERVQHLSSVRIIGGAASADKGAGRNASLAATAVQDASESASPQLAGHVHAFAHVLIGPSIDAETMVSLQRSTPASGFLQELLKAVANSCVPYRS